jgi:hypothetical protein
LPCSTSFKVFKIDDPLANQNIDTFASLKADKQRVRQTATDGIRKFLQAFLGCTNQNPLSADQFKDTTIHFPLLRQTAEFHKDAWHWEIFEALLSDLEELIQLYSLVFKAERPEQYQTAMQLHATSMGISWGSEKFIVELLLPYIEADDRTMEEELVEVPGVPQAYLCSKCEV